MESTHPAASPTPLAHGQRVLVVDDDRWHRNLMVRLLNRAGYEAIAAEDGPSALILSAVIPPDLVLLDFMMNGMTGADVVRRMREQSRMRDTPILLLTGSKLGTHIEEGLGAGADDYLFKPINRRILTARVMTALRAREDRRRATEAEALAIERDALIAEIEEATTVQWALLPRGALEWPGFRAAGMVLPCSAVGGDLFDVLEGVDDRRVAVLLDVAGHGLGAAVLAASIRAELRALLLIYAPATALSLLNDHLFSDGSSRYACIAAAEASPGGVTIFNAGLPPVCVGRAGEIRALVQATGMPLGLLPARTYTGEFVPLEAGDRVVLMSDGLVEPFGSAEDVQPTLEALAALHADRLPCEPDAIAARLRGRMAEVAGGARDDVTLLLLEALA